MLDLYRDKFCCSLAPIPLWTLLCMLCLGADSAAAQITFSSRPADALVNCNFIPTPPILTATSTCVGVVSVTYVQSKQDGNCANNYTLTRTWRATDLCGAAATHSQILTVSDTQAPVIAGVPANVTVTTGAIPGDPAASAIDFCDARPTLSVVKDSIAGACGGFSIVRFYTASDACGNTRTRRYVITVNNDTPPVISGVTPGGRLTCGAGLPAPPHVTATDNAGTPLLSVRVDTLTGFGRDTCRVMRRIWTATDNCGLQSTAAQTFVLIDGTGPTLTGVPANTTIYCTALPPPPAIGSVIRATDACDPAPTIRYEERSEQTSTGSCSDVNYRVVRIWTATDACGNETVRTQVLLMKCECCGNGIDDDDDGLTDDYDPQCNCFAGVEAACDSMKRYYIPPIWQASNAAYNSPSSLVITTLAPEARFHITTADGTTYNRNFIVRKGTPLIIDLTVNQLQTPNHDRVERTRGWIITSDQLIQPIFRIDGFYSKDIATIKGPQALGRVFRAGSQTNTCDPNSMENGEGHFISVMATEDNTQVTIRMTFPGLNGLNGTVVKRLNRHETWLIRDDARNTTVTGSLITSTKPIAVITGSQHTRACMIGGSGQMAPGQDAGFDQLVPNCLTGNEYVMVRGKNDPTQQYAILVANKHDTRILVNGNPASEIVLQAGEYRQVFLGGADYSAHHFRGNKPFYAYQIAGISRNNEVGMAICAPVGECKGDTLIEFPTFSGNSGGKLVDNSVYAILPQRGLTSLRINGQPYNTCATARPVPARPDLSVVVFENGCLNASNSISCDERFTSGILVGIDGNTGLHGYLSSFKDRMEVREPRTNRVVTAYLVDTVCGRSTYTHCINVASCATDHTIAAVHPQHGTVTLDGGSCFTYHAPVRYQGIDQVLVTVQNDQGLFQTVCLSFYVCASPPDVLFNFLDTTVSCSQVPPMQPPIMSDECGMRIQFEAEDFRLDGSCENNYLISRHWIFWDDCGDSTRVKQFIRVKDTLAPIALSIPSDTLIAACAGLPPVPLLTFQDNCDNSVETSFSQITLDSTCVYDLSVLRSWEAWDVCGNRTTAQQRISLRDTAAPVLSQVPTFVVLGCGEASALPLVTAQDDCDPTPVIVLDSVVVARSCDTIRDVLRRWTATDACGRSSTRTQRVLVIDRTPPQILSVPPDITVSCGSALPTAEPVFIDDCTSPVPVYSVDSVVTGTCPVIKQIFRRWTAVDQCGHESSATQIISVVDTVGPRFLPLPDTIFSSCLDSVVVVEPMVLEDCDFVMTFSDSMAAGPGCNGERLLYRHYVISDACDRRAELTQLYYFRDAVPPVWLQEPADVVLACDDPIPAVIDPSYVDACSGLNPVAVVIRDSSRVCPATRWIIRDYTISDWCGNLSYFSHHITIIGCEPVAPVLATGQAGCTGEDIVLQVLVDSGYVTPVYQWQFSNNGGLSWTTLSQPADSATLTLPNANPSWNGIYRVNVADKISDLGTADCSSLSNPIPLTIRPPVATTQDVAICRGDTLFYLGEALTTSLNRTDSLQTWYGCDSVVTLRLTVFPYVELRVDSTVCFGESLSYFGQTYSVSGTFRDTLVTAYGCDTTLLLTLRVLPDLRDTTALTLCAGAVHQFEGTTITAPGTYTSPLAGRFGCDSSKVLVVNYLDNIAHDVDSTVCSGQQVRVGSQVYSSAGTFLIVLRAASGCDSTVTLHLQVMEPTTTRVDAHVCAGETYFFGNERLTTAGVYTRVMRSRYGCDSTIELHLRQSPRYEQELRVELCEGEIYSNGSYQITRAGRWPLQFFTADGCDSTIYVTLSYRRHQFVTLSETLCLGEQLYSL